MNDATLVLELHKNYFVSFNKSSVSEMLGVTTVCNGVVVRDLTILLFPVGVADTRGDGDGVYPSLMLLPPATRGVPVLAISFLAAGESICSRSVLLGVPSLARKAGLKNEEKHKIETCTISYMYSSYC